MKKILGRRFSLDTVLKASSLNDQVLCNLSKNVEDYGQKKELPAKGYGMHIPSILRTNENYESAIIVRDEGSAMKTKREISPPNESGPPELPQAQLCEINFRSKSIQTALNTDGDDTTKASSSDNRSLLRNCTDSATDCVASPALNLSIENHITDQYRISSHDNCAVIKDRTSTLLEQGMIQSCKESFCDDDGFAISNETDDHRKRSLIHSDENRDGGNDCWRSPTKIMKTDHGTNSTVNVFRSVICSATYDENVRHGSHMVINSAEKTYSFELGQKNFRGKGDMDRHNCVNSDVKPFSCELCSGVSFNTRYALKRHMECHSNFKTFCCEHCNLSFKRKYGLKRHEVVHFAEKLFSCEHCNKSFKRKDDLKKHEVIHSDEKPFGCEQCNISFKRKNELNRHKVIHIDKKPFICELCNRSFNRKLSLQQHEAIHLDEKPFRCLLCHRTFSRKQSLKVHNLVHSEKRRFSCDAAARHSEADNVSNSAGSFPLP